ncbi:MAG: hypothetical protein CML04_09545 [Pseudozobellia sp.]|nr:hypothetical protein [Pseudozobellia sp.]|tara:strand:+ start:2329 stop:4497 length:2169 start_codon:yes stop_codon:yes gene_type:complete
MAATGHSQQYLDQPFLQDQAKKYILNDSLKDEVLIKVSADRNGLIQVLGDSGLLLPFEKSLVKDQRYRPLIDMNILDLQEANGKLYYLSSKEVFTNAAGGTFYFNHEMNEPKLFALGQNETVLVVSKNQLKIFESKEVIWEQPLNEISVKELLFDANHNRFLLLTSSALYEVPLSNLSFEKIFDGEAMNTITLFKNSILVGTDNGVVELSGSPLKVMKIQNELPSNHVTALKVINDELWYGSTKGAFKLRADGKYDYYASKRWLIDDEVLTLTEGPENSVIVLTSGGLSQIEFHSLTLEEKANYFQKIQRERHLRYGLTANLSFREPGNIATGYFNDSDNDGLWTSMYLAGELFRYAVTKSEDAKLNAYDAFEAMKRLTDITPMHGFPARSYERDGYEVGLHANGFSEEWYQKHVKENGRIWRLTDDEKWRWKSTTSSDESCGHFFVYALFAELAPDKEWRDRAIHQIKIQTDHIMNNDWYLVDWNGEPTAWGRWNPKYVNQFPINVGDRRLNSTLILAFLQTAYHFTKDEKYKKAANKLIKRHGYDENANRPASVIGFVEGEDLSNKWNHSDDEMYFLTIPAFVKYSFDEAQKTKHFEAVKSHWEIERSEKNPLWNYLFALSGGTQIDFEESAWWLREFPMDLIDWSVDNSHRTDLKKIEPNFRGQTYSEVLPPDERPLHKHNGAYRNNGNGGGKREYAPYIYLLPYWAGRYVEAISAPQN